MKEKTLKIIAVVLAITTVASVAAFFLTKNKGVSGPESILNGAQPPETVYSYDASAYTAKVSVKGTNGEIFLPSDI